MITVVVLGTAQDGGVPHLGCQQPRCERARREPALARRVASLGVIDSEAKQSYLIDATPDVRSQLDALTSHPLAPARAGANGVRTGRKPTAFGTPSVRGGAASARTAGERAPEGRNPVHGLILTHAHIGHYTGLVQFGKEVMATRELPTYCTASMQDFLQSNGPWSQLLRDSHLVIHVLNDNQPIRLTDGLSIRPFLVPHRQEWSDTIGLELIGPAKRLLYIPDIDRWSDWPCDLRAAVSAREIALLDGCFHEGGELPVRSMAEVPHPWMTDTMEQLEGVRTQVLFTHMNHTNPALAGSARFRRGQRRDGVRAVNRRYPTFKDASECGRCTDLPSPEFIHGLEQFNRGEFFAQHETLEGLWITERDEVRSLYKGILQVGVGFHHLFDRHNYRGAVIKLGSGCRWLRAFQPRCRGVEVAQLIADTQRALAHLVALGPERMSEFDRSLVVKIQYTIQHLPVEVY